MADTRPNYSTSSAVRSVTSYPARRGFKQGPVDPSLDYVIGVDDSIDIHCHAHEGQRTRDVADNRRSQNVPKIKAEGVKPVELTKDRKKYVSGEIVG